jgi:hypothetical protein
MTTERQAVIEQLVGFPHGIDRAEAELMARDLDLWMQSPGFLCAIEDKDAVEEWEVAHEFFNDLATMAVNSRKPTFNTAITHMLFDAEARAREALRRAEERAREASHGEE